MSIKDNIKDNVATVKLSPYTSNNKFKTLSLLSVLAIGIALTPQTRWQIAVTVAATKRKFRTMALDDDQLIREQVVR